MPTPSAASTPSFSNTPQAKDDAYAYTENGGITYLTVLSNDLGGAAKSLYSVGSSSATLRNNYDANAEYLSAKGARVAIQTTGANAGTISYNSGAIFESLAAGQTTTDTITYAIRLGNGTLSWATATITITGTNDAPVVSGVVTGNAMEDGNAVTLSALANASDVDAGTQLNVVNVADTLPAGVSYDIAAKTFMLDAANAAYQSLAAGQTKIVTVSYGVTDGTATTAASASWTITGTNDAPVVSGAVTANATEDGASVSVNALLNASDVDTGAVLTVTSVPASLPAGVTFDATTNTFTLDPAAAAYQSLAEGEEKIVTVTYGVTDGLAVTAAEASWTIVGKNDAASITGTSAGNVKEDTTLTVTGTLKVTDVDSPETVRAQTDVEGSFGKFSVDTSGKWTYTLNNSADAVQKLNTSDTRSESFTVVSQDGTATQVVNVSIAGLDDNRAPVAYGDYINSTEWGYQITEDESVNLRVLSNDQDPDGDVLSIASFSATSEMGATISVNADGTLRYDARTSAALQALRDWEGTTDTFTYSVKDSHGVTSNTATVQVQVVGRNDVGIITGAKSGTVTEDTQTIVSGKLTIVDPDQGASSFSTYVDNYNYNYYGQFNIDSEGNWTYQLNNDYSQVQQLREGQSVQESFTVRSDDWSTQQQVTINIVGKNDAPVAVADSAGKITFEEGTYQYTYDNYNGQNAIESGGYKFTLGTGTGSNSIYIQGYYGADNTNALGVYGYNYSYYDYYYGYYNSYSGPTTVSVNMAKADGSSFSIDSANVTGYGYNYYYGGSNMVETITGYLNGVQVAQKIVSVPDTSYGGNVNNNVILDAAAWDNVDKVVFSLTKSGGYNYYGYYNYTYQWLDNVEVSQKTNSPLDINVLLNDKDMDQGSTLKVGSFQATSAHGAAITLNANGTLHYDPTVSAELIALSSNDTTEDYFTYQAVDELGALSDIVVVNVTLVGV